MIIRLTNLFLLTFLAMNCYSQETSTIISGKIIGFNNSISNVHIINLRNKHGTISNDLGNFNIKVKINDTLLLSAIQYKNKKIVISKSHFLSKKIRIHLKPSVTILDEVFLHGLTGNLNSDISSTPKDMLSIHNFVYKLRDLNKILPPDTHGFLSAPNSLRMTDPTYMGGAGGSAGIPDYYMIKVRKLKRELSQKKQFPINIKKDLGINFFTKKINISEEKINHFLSYCESKNIIEIYYKNNLLEVIKIMLEESISYNEIQNNQ